DRLFAMVQLFVYNCARKTPRHGYREYPKTLLGSSTGWKTLWCCTNRCCQSCRRRGLGMLLSSNTFVFTDLAVFAAPADLRRGSALVFTRRYWPLKSPRY